MIKINKLEFTYHDCGKIIDEIFLSINKGEKVGLIGPNGAGKTTLFHLICGILKPDSGNIVVKEKTVTPGNFNPDVGFVFQNPDDQLFNASVLEDVSFGPLNLGLEVDEVKKRVDYALEVTETEKVIHRPSHHLSGGEKRMVAIATIISMKPEVVLFDEPTSNLDMRSRRGLIEFINNKIGTALIASHDLEFILETCERTLLFNHGKVIADDKSSVIMDNEKLMLEHGLERPHSLLHREDHCH